MKKIFTLTCTLLLLVSCAHRGHHNCDCGQEQCQMKDKKDCGGEQCDMKKKEEKKEEKKKK